MQFVRTLSHTRFMLVAVVGFSLCCAAGAQAQEPLRWKFTKGAKFDYNMVQDMTIGSVATATAPAQNVKMHQELQMTWDVKEVNNEGDAIIEQKISRVKMKMELPVGNLEYDSASKEAPAGPAAMLAPMYKAMTEGVFTITMTPRGEIKDVKIPNEVVEAIKKSPGAAGMGDMASAEGFKKMISQGSLVLPEAAPKEGEEWSTKVELNNPAAGKQVVETTYHYKGMKDVEGKKFAEFKPTITMSFEAPQVKIAEQKSDGEILFNVAEGRLDSSKLEQHVTIEQVGGNKTQIDQEIVVEVKAAGEGSSEEKAAAPADDVKKTDEAEEDAKKN